MLFGPGRRNFGLRVSSAFICVENSLTMHQKKIGYTYEKRMVLHPGKCAAAGGG